MRFMDKSSIKENPAWKKRETCQCGCSQEYLRVRPWQKFATKHCRTTYWAKIRQEVYKIVRERQDSSV